MPKGTSSAPVVVSTDGSRHSHQAVRRAAQVAASHGQLLHVVAAYDLRDTTEHRLQRCVAPADVCHAISPIGEAEELLREALDAITGIDVDVLTHARQGTLEAAVRRVARETGGTVLDPEPVLPMRATFARLATALRGSPA